ncbi:MAG: SAF domain-containing protein [Thermaerobacter sp.]|nr:SAF domain-containing protein [Thermaerobacter sp.]
MSHITQDLAARAAAGHPITVAVVGAGQMGRGLVSSLETIRGMQAAMVIDVEAERAINALTRAGVPREQIKVSDGAEQAARWLAEGLRVVATDADHIPAQGIEAVVEATGVPEVGARVALDTIGRGQHIILLNVETDVTVGRILKKLADMAGVVYSVSAGDEPGATVELVEFARTLGFTVVAAGKGKNNVLDPDATPDTVQEEALRKHASPHMFCSFVDGTKTMVEMTAVSNATGLVPEMAGMRGMHLSVDDLAATFSTVAQGGVLTRTGVVDFVHGIAPGVFAVITSGNEEIREDMDYLKVGPGPNWTLYRPYHLANLETPHTIAKAVLYHDVCLAPGERPVAETVAVAKRDLQPGATIDGLGGYSVRGLIMAYDEAASSGALPLGLAQNAQVVRPVAKGEVIRYADVEIHQGSLVAVLRRLQDSWLGGGK